MRYAILFVGSLLAGCGPELFLVPNPDIRMEMPDIKPVDNAWKDVKLCMTEDGKRYCAEDVHAIRIPSPEGKKPAP